MRPNESKAKNDEPPKLSAEVVLSLISCPIGLMPMTDPVMAADGYFYEKANIERWIQVALVSDATAAVFRPMTGEALPHHRLSPVRTMKSFIHSIPEDQLKLLSTQPRSEPLVLAADRDGSAQSRNIVRHAKPILQDEKMAHTRTSAHIRTSAVSFFQQDPNLIQVDQLKQNELVGYCALGDSEGVKLLLNGGYAISLNLADSKGNYPLAAAIMSLNFELVKYIFENANFTLPQLSTALLYNESTYSVKVPPAFKKYTELSCSDICSGYFEKRSGRQAIFADWLWRHIGCPYGAWTGITLNQQRTEATAHTRSAGDWKFGDDNQKLVAIVEGLGRGRDARCVVWGHFMAQYAKCIQNQELIAKLVESKQKLLTQADDEKTGLEFK